LSDAADRTTAPGLRPHDDHPDPSVAARGAVDTAAIRVVMQSTDKPRVAVIGAGSWGTTFAKVLAEGGAETVLWARRPEIAREITETKRNSEYLPGINLPRTLTANTSLARVLDGAEQVYVSVRMSEVLLQGLGIDQDRIAVASGPNLALEIARRQPTAAVVSSSSADTATEVAAVATNPYFRSFINTDVIGTEFGGVLKNLIAVAIGIVDGVGYGENTKASIITRGLAEMTEFAVSLGAQPSTLSGLAGLGDLIATCQSPLSRNNTAGRLLGQGYRFDEVVRQMNQTAEGLASVAPILELAAANGVDMPIVGQVAEVLAGRLDPRNIAPHLTETDEPQGE
jgi:glycerol-3-phosphate dehydrogenase (NAD(P)+)